MSRRARLLVVAICLLGAPASVGAATYYVDSAITDTNVASATADCTNYDPAAFVCSGGSASAYTTLADINARTQSANDFVLFRRGQTWRGEMLTVPSSGTSGNPITYGAFGTGADPVFAGVLTTAWALPAGDGTWSAAQQSGNIQGNETSGVVENLRMVIAAGSITTSGSSLRLRLTGSTGGSTTIQKLTIGEQHATNPEDFASAPTSLRIAGADVSAANPITVPQSGSITTDFTTFTLDETKTYLIHAYNTTAFPFHSRWLSGSAMAYYHTTNTDFSGTLDYTASGSVNALYIVSEIQVPSAVTDVWESAVVSAPSTVSFDGVPGLIQTSYAAVNAAREWYWAAGALYVYSLTDPDTAYVAPGIEAGAQTRSVQIIAKTDITLDNLDLRHSNGFGINLDNGDRVVISDVAVSLAGSSGINVEDGSDTVLISGCVVTDNGFGPTGGDRNGIGVGGNDAGSSNVTITGCTLDGNWNHQIDVASTSTDAVAATVTISKNNIFDGVHGGILIGGGHTGIVIAYNVIENNAESGVMINKGATSGNPVTSLYNNVIWGNGTAGTTNLNHGIAYSPDGNTQTFKNNIVGESNGLEIEKGSGSTLASDYNLWYHSAGGTFMKYHGVTYTFANWKTNSSQDANSLSTDPLFVTAGSDFHLQATSPAIDAGVSVGLTSDYDGVSVPSGAAPDIGAFEKVLSRPAIILMGVGN